MATDVEKYEQLRNREATRTAAQFSQEISDSLIRNHHWGTLLSAAPLALSFVGACQVVASSPAASGLKLKKPKNGFTHLQYESLQANLVYLVDIGRKTFIETESRMDKLVMHSRYLFSETGTVNRIIDALNDEQGAKKTLPACMNTLKSTVGECENHLQVIEAKFEAWLDVAQELSQVATESEHDTIDKRHENQDQVHSQKIRKEFAEKEMQRKEEAVREAQRRMLLAEDAFKHASKNIPSGWDVVGMSVVDVLSQSVFSIGGALVTALTPHKYVALGQSVFDTLKSTLMKDHNDDHEHFEGPGSNVGRHDDPACMHLDNLLTYLSLLSSVVNGGLLPAHQQDGAVPSNSPGTIRTFLEIMDHDLPDNAAPGSYSYDAKYIVNEALEIIHEIQDVAKSKREISGSSSPIAWETWQKKVADLQARAASLKARKDNLEGMAAGATPPRLKKHSKRYKASQSIVRAQLDRAAAAFESSTASLEVQREAYDASVTRLNQNLERISDIQLAIGKLQAENVTLEEIVRILRASISALSGLKEQITSLLRFFQGISGMVEFAARGPCRDLLETLETGIERDESGAIAGVTFRDFQKQVLLNTTLMIRGYFSVVFEVSRLYCDVSREYIIPGVNLIDSLGLSQNRDITNQRNKELEQYKRSAVQAIRELAEKKQQALLSRMDQRISYLQETVPSLPECSEKKAIELTAEEEAARARSEAEQEGEFVDVAAHLFTGHFNENL
ncbi:Ncu06413-like protein [Lasiodiplodia theobromae]|uniref:Ncu06413-like protein n=1 Tax=Lasiodiplodia theobromae TaxID=45133 RepID=UPI0015C376A9|nr:Ncu06413-like protein [Lasiodiplodia theobromae]KAF4540101.1 Ncu06413-like protein [Lasiodiplodia theobromae]